MKEHFRGGVDVPGKDTVIDYRIYQMGAKLNISVRVKKAVAQTCDA